MENDSRDDEALSVVTSFGPAGYELYGRGFIDTFKQHWPRKISLSVYWEGEKPRDDIDGYDLLSLESCASFLKRYAGNMMVCGKVPHPRFPWGRKANASGYNFRFDAYKFARKVFAVAHAARHQKTGKLFWIDADVVTHSPMDRAFLERILPQDKSLSYLARPGYHSELGFVGYNLDHPTTIPFINEYERQYADDVFIEHYYWDDCNVFDRLVHTLRPPVKHIMSTSRAYPFDASALSRYMKHNKGRRKES